MNAPSASCLIFEVLPAICHPDPTNPALDRPSETWVQTFGPQLAELDVVRSSPSSRARVDPREQQVGVHSIRPTALARSAADALTRLGFASIDTTRDNAFVITDLSGLDTEESLEIVRQVQRAGCRSIAIWKRGAETFYGPLVEPLRTACWNCCRLRFSDSVASEDNGLVEDEPTAARVIAENVLLAVRYPEVAAFGCVLVDDGRTSSLHSILPLPWCDACGGAAAMSEPRDASVTHSLHVPERLRILADPRGSIVRKVLLYQGDGAEAPVVPCCCSAVIASYHDGSSAHPGFSGEGKGATDEDAITSAIGEGVERYAASIWDPSALTCAAFDDIEEGAFDPRWLVLYDDAQYARSDFPFAPFDSKRPMCWTTGSWLDTKEPVRVPALATYLNFPAVAAEQFAQTTSSGLAAGATFDDAALRALYELIERDAFMLFWLTRRPALRVAEDDCEAVTSRALREVERLGATTELYLIDVGTHHPTFVCLGLGDGRSWPGVTIGLGTHANPDVALRRAVFEHGHYGAYIRRLMRDDRRHHDLRRDDVVSSLDHALYYIDPAHATALEWFRGSTAPPASLADVRSWYRQDASLSTCVSRLLEAGIRTAAVDVTSPDVTLAPVRVVRAFGVHMQPIHFGVSNRRLKNPRLEPLQSDGIETNPHPIA